MKSFYGLIPRYLMKNKKRNLFLGLSICIFATFITLLNVVNNYGTDMSIQKCIDFLGGDWDVKLTTSKEDELKKIDEYSYIKDYTTKINLGKKLLDTKERISLNVDGYDEKAKDILNLKLLEGKYPEGDNEIALQKWIIPYLNLGEVKIGDLIELDLETSNFGKLKSYATKEKYKLVGIIDYMSTVDKKLNSTGVGYVTSDFVEKILPKQYRLYEKNYRFSKDEKFLNTAMKVSEDLTVQVPSEVFINYPKEETLKGIEFAKQQDTVIFTMISIVFIIVIYNLFNISFTMRVKDIGMLKSLGCTYSNLRNMFLGEGILIGLIFLSIGIFSGNILSQIIIKLLLNGNYKYQLVSFNFETVKLCLVYVLGSIVIGSLSALRKIKKISAVELIAYEGNDSGKIKNRKSIVGDNKFYKSMAVNNIKRSRKIFISTVISLSLTILITIVINYLNASGISKEEFKGEHWDFTINNDGYNLDESILHDIEKVDGVKYASGVKYNKYYLADIPKDKFTKLGMGAFDPNVWEVTKKAFNDNRYLVQIPIYSYEDSKVQELIKNLKEGVIDINSFNNEDSAILIQGEGKNAYYDLKINEELNFIDTAEKKKAKLKIHGVLDLKNFEDKEGDRGTMLLVSKDTFDRNFSTSNYEKINIYLNDKQDYEKVKERLNEKYGIIKGIKIGDYIEDTKEAENRNLGTVSISYFIVMIVVISSIFNVFNIMSMNLILRKKELSMLRAIGISKEEIKKMLKKEADYYSIYSIVIGGSMGIISTLMLFLFGGAIYVRQATWIPPILELLILGGILFIVIRLAVLNSCKYIFSESIVEGVTSVE